MATLRENNTELRCRNKQLERDKLEWESLRKVFDMKCEEYIVEVRECFQTQGNIFNFLPNREYGSFKLNECELLSKSRVVWVSKLKN